MSKIRVTFTEKFFIEDHAVTYHGVLIPLYGLLDEFIDIYYIDVVSDEVKLFYERKFKNNFTIEQKLRLIAETDRGRLIIKEFSEFGTNASFAETKRRFVPDWYINPNGPISSLTNGNHSYSEYYYLPLNSEERWKRYVGTLPPSVPLIASLFQKTSGVIARIISRSSSRDSTPGRDSRDSTPDRGSEGTRRGSLSIDGRLTVDAGEIRSPLRTPAPSEYDTADDITPIASPTDIAPQSESEILTTVEEIKDWYEQEPLDPALAPPPNLQGDFPLALDPLDPQPLAPPPNLQGDFPPTYDDSKKDILVAFAPNEAELNREYEDLNKGAIKSLLTPPSTVINFMQNALNIKYIKTDDEVRRLVEEPNFKKFLPKNFNDSEDMNLIRSQTIRAYTRLVVSLGYTYAKLSNLRELLAVQYKYLSPLSEEAIKTQVKAFTKQLPDFSSIKYKLTPKEIEEQKVLVTKELIAEEEQIKGKEEATKILTQSVGLAKTTAAKLLKLIEDKQEIKLSFCPQLTSTDNLAIILTMMSKGNISEVKKLCSVYDIPVPSSVTSRKDIGEHIKTEFGKMNLKGSKYILAKFNIGSSGGWSGFTK